MAAAATDATRTWIDGYRRYVAVSFVANLVWECIQFPLYTQWATSGWREIAFDIAHCTAGDVMIATLALVTALALLGNAGWPAERFAAVAALTIGIGIAYTVYSEWINVAVRKSWSYAPLMPVVPPLGTGLSPLLQWMLVPALALWSISGPPTLRARMA